MKWDQEIMNTICYLWIAVAIGIHITMFYITAPFGRHTSTKWGKSMSNKWGWFIMELPSLAIMLYFFIYSVTKLDSYTWILFLCWIFHYTNRTILYPLRIKSTPKQIPILIVLSAIFFNLINAGLNGYQLGILSGENNYGLNWISSIHFKIGISLFILGMYINMHADNILIHLRKKGDTGYQIPKGFLFEYISSPNLFGEIVEWAGFAIMAWNLPAFTFMIWTYANLVPRAKNHHEWYVQHFSNYPKNRKIVFPFIY